MHIRLYRFGGVTLAMIHLFVHMSMCRKFVDDPSSIVALEDVGVEENLSYEEVLAKSLDRQVNKMKNKKIAPVMEELRSGKCYMGCKDDHDKAIPLPFFFHSSLRYLVIHLQFL